MKGSIERTLVRLIATSPMSCYEMLGRSFEEGGPRETKGVELSGGEWAVGCPCCRSCRSRSWPLRSVIHGESFVSPPEMSMGEYPG